MLFEKSADLLRIGIAAGRAEGFLEAPGLPKWMHRRHLENAETLRHGDPLRRSPRREWGPLLRDPTGRARRHAVAGGPDDARRGLPHRRSSSSCRTSPGATGRSRHRLRTGPRTRCGWPCCAPRCRCSCPRWTCRCGVRWRRSCWSSGSRRSAWAGGGRWLIAYVATLAGTMYARIGIALGPDEPARAARLGRAGRRHRPVGGRRGARGLRLLALPGLVHRRRW